MRVAKPSPKLHCYYAIVSCSVNDGSEYSVPPMNAVGLTYMSNLTYGPSKTPKDKPFVWMRAEVKSPPFSREARLEAGFLLRNLQRGRSLEMPHSRPMPAIGGRCHELRIIDVATNWRIICRVDPDAIVIADVFRKKPLATPKAAIERAKKKIAGV
jgi:phage-related protein